MSKPRATYRGFTIFKDGRGFWVEQIQKRFKSLAMATTAIDFSKLKENK